MYLIQETTDKAAMTRGTPGGPGVCREVAERAAKMQVWGSSFNDPGDDFCEFVLLDANGVVIDRRRVAGY
jgi:hypothetical protein